MIPIAGADQFFATLKQRVDTIDQSQRQNPLSIEMLISSTKRYLAKSEYRIQLDELFSQETERLLEQLNTANLLANTPFIPKEFQSRVEIYEALTEPLARMAGVLGRWGDGDEFSVVMDIVRSLHNYAIQGGGGFVIWLNLRSYPAVLILTAYGLGLTRARRWKELHLLLSSMLMRDSREPRRVVSTLFLLAWEGADNDVWRNLQGLENHKTALSDHLLMVMSEWKKSFIGTEPDFELMYERFETLGALAHFEENNEADLEAAAANTTTRSRDVLSWMPIGRVGWHSSSHRSLTQEFGNESYVTDLLGAGFAKKSPRFLQLFLENLNRFAARMSW